jgi:hypothetical protein
VCFRTAIPNWGPEFRCRGTDPKRYINAPHQVACHCRSPVGLSTGAWIAGPVCQALRSDRVDWKGRLCLETSILIPQSSLGFLECSGIEFKCVGAKSPYPMSFQQHVPLREIKASGGSFSGTYRYVSSSIARPRAALLRRASVGNFEIVEESADKKSKTVRFRIDK